MTALAARCSGCSWRVTAETLAQLQTAAMWHDDSPGTRHIVTLDPPRPWPENETAFAELTIRELLPNTISKPSVTLAQDVADRTTRVGDWGGD